MAKTTLASERLAMAQRISAAYVLLAWIDMRAKRAGPWWHHDDVGGFAECARLVVYT